MMLNDLKPTFMVLFLLIFQHLLYLHVPGGPPLKDALQLFLHTSNLLRLQRRKP
jgi:hypothetical protein